MDVVDEGEAWEGGGAVWVEEDTDSDAAADGADAASEPWVKQARKRTTATMSANERRMLFFPFFFRAGREEDFNKQNKRKARERKNTAHNSSSTAEQWDGEGAELRGSKRQKRKNRQWKGDDFTWSKHRRKEKHHSSWSKHSDAQATRSRSTPQPNTLDDARNFDFQKPTLRKICFFQKQTSFWRSFSRHSTSKAHAHFSGRTEELGMAHEAVRRARPWTLTDLVNTNQDVVNTVEGSFNLLSRFCLNPNSSRMSRRWNAFARRCKGHVKTFEAQVQVYLGMYSYFVETWCWPQREKWEYVKKRVMILTHF